MTTDDRLSLFTLMVQWSRDSNIQFQEIADWVDKHEAEAFRLATCLALLEAAKVKCYRCAEGLPVEQVAGQGSTWFHRSQLFYGERGNNGINSCDASSIHALAAKEQQ